MADMPTLSIRHAELEVRELPAPRALATVIARRGAGAAAAAFIAGQLPQVLPEATALASGPGHWLVLVEGTGDPDPQTDPLAGPHLEAQLTAAVGALASVCDQTGGRVRFSVAGRLARELLARGVGIDLHPDRFAVGQSAVTSIGHMGVQFRQVDDLPTYHLLVVRSYAGSFRHWLQTTAAALGAR